MNKKDSRIGGIGSKSKRGSISRRKSAMEEELLHRQALAIAIQQHQLSQRFENGSMSRRIGSTSSRRRAANLSDPFSNATNNKQVYLFALCSLFYLSKAYIESRVLVTRKICGRLVSIWDLACVSIKMIRVVLAVGWRVGVGWVQILKGKRVCDSLVLSLLYS